MRRRIYVFCAFAVVAAAAFIRLGVWQIARLGERKAYNAAFTRQHVMQRVDVSQLPRNADSARYRGVSVRGTYDYAHELVISPRTRRGSPGVELLTPVRRAGTDTAVLVDRGWVYSPDLSTIDQPRWREHDSASVLGYVERFTPETTVTRARNPNVVRHVATADVAARIPYPVLPYYVIALGDTDDLTHPARRELPALDEGSHLNYAFQWFTFAAIALGGAAIVVRRERRVR